ncbi:MAG: methyltransferase [Rickettsiales bacterium]|nr:methyltransferase [Rickettsiales bacterium]|tara:strand:- start:1365 stop:2153 length:789 start_codon:yes stop_codon:yes gene_type:complete
MQIMIKLIFFVILLTSFESYSDELLKNAILNQNRKIENIKRDNFRNPYETLTFFEINNKMKVLEVSPGNGWYSEVLSFYLKNSKGYYVTKYKKPPIKIIEKNQIEFDNYFNKNIEKFGEVKSIYFNEKNFLDSEVKDFDLVLTFRNTHNWLGSKTADNVYKSIYQIMKKGGILGIVQHRANENSKNDFKNGYVKQSFLIKFIEKQGFKFINKSEINANTKDTKDYEKGVWTLPPRLILGDKQKDKFLQIGESDRMTLKFIKP